METPEITPLGKILNEPAVVYHGCGAVSNSKLKVFAEDPLLYYMRFVDKSILAPSSKSFDIGTAFHARCENLKSYRKIVAVNERYSDLRTKNAQHWKARHESNGRTVISQRDHEMISRMVYGFRNNPLAMELLRNTEREVTWRARIGKFVVQCRTDRWCGEGRFIKSLNEKLGPYFVDFKTVPSLADFSANLSNYNYHHQDAFYKEVIKQVVGPIEKCPADLAEYACPRAFFIVSEKEAPWSTLVYELDEEAQRIGRQAVLIALTNLRNCYETGKWFRPQTKLRTAALKFWKSKEEELSIQGYRAALP